MKSSTVLLILACVAIAPHMDKSEAKNIAILLLAGVLVLTWIGD